MGGLIFGIYGIERGPSKTTSGGLGCRSTGLVSTLRMLYILGVEAEFLSSLGTFRNSISRGLSWKAYSGFKFGGLC